MLCGRSNPVFCRAPKGALVMGWIAPGPLTVPDMAAGRLGN
jgi:hypothetical protein